MRRLMTLSLAFLLMLILAGCGNSRAEQSMVEEGGYVPGAPAPSFELAAEAPMMDEGMAFDAVREAGQPQAAVEGQERLIIRSADMGVIVTDTEEAMRTVTSMVNENGGWVVSSNVYQYDQNAMTGSMSVRVPAAGFDSFIEAISGLAVEVTRISTSGQDVTEEYVDLDARLGNLEATADRLRTFLDDTRNVKDALAVSNELSRVEGEIESYKGRMKYLKESSAFSSVNIDFTPDILAQPLEVGGWQPQGVVRSAIESLIGALQTLADILIWFAIFVLPLLLLIGLPVVLLIRWFRGRRASRKAAVAVQTAVEPADDVIESS
jgi:hypothetical protein